MHDSGSVGYGLAVDSSGSIYACGNANGQLWRVLKSTDIGETWTISDTFSGSTFGPWRLAVDSEDVVYAAGQWDTGIEKWIVRRSTDLGSTWSTVDEINRFSQDCVASGLAIDTDDKVYVCGLERSTSSDARWLVRSSSDGTTWGDADIHNTTTGLEWANRVAVNPVDNSVYVAGMQDAASSAENLGLLRLSGDKGETWETIQKTDAMIVTGKQQHD